ncbi:hypothetical protein GCM10020255_008710 [Rhodococcus baikonurensis]
MRLEQEKLCLLVMIGVRADGRKELVALTDGYRESAESWADLLRGCRRRGMTAPVLAVGDGALGFWRALREVFPETREQRCWFHKQSNVLAALPKSAHPGALAAMKEIYIAEDIDKAQVAIKAFELDYGAKYPKAVAKIVDDIDVLLEFYKYPAEHWVHLRTTNPIESTFATVRLRTKVTKGPGSRAAGLAMAYKLIDAAQARWRAVNAPHLVALVRAGAVFHKGNCSNDPPTSPHSTPGQSSPQAPDRRSPETISSTGFDNISAKHVFISYVRQDSAEVDKLCDLLKAANIAYWRDRESLGPGDAWKRVIRDAIQDGTAVFLACFSANQRAKEKSVMNEEIGIAVEEYRLRRPGKTWLVPVRFDDGDIDDWDLGANRSLRDINYVDLFGDRYTRYCQFLWMREFQATSDPVLAGSVATAPTAVMSVGRSSSLPLWKTAPPALAQPNVVR